MPHLLVVMLTTLALGMPAPSTAQHLNERLDRETGVTVTSQAEPAVFARPQPQFSRSARDYVYLGPFEINRQGQRTYYLWVGVGTTIDRGYLAPVTPAPETLYVTTDGELVELPLHAANELGFGVGAGSIYETKVPLRAEYFARVTLDQLRLLADAELGEIVVKTQEETLERFASWGSRQPSWSAFVASLSANSSAPEAAGR